MVINLIPGDCLNFAFSSVFTKKLVIKSDVSVSLDVDFNSHDDDVYVINFKSSK